MSVTLEALVKQAGWTASEYMNAAVEAIDKKFGKDYARNSPDLVGAFMQTAALDFLAVTLKNELEKISNK